MNAVFADTHFWIALANPKDEWHGPARKARESLGSVIVITSDEVLTEFVTSFARYGALFRRKAVETVRALLKNPNVRVIPQTRNSFLRAIELFATREDKDYSLTDCSSMIRMRDEGITGILTHDHHFEQEGFSVLVR